MSDNSVTKTVASFAELEAYCRNLVSVTEGDVSYEYTEYNDDTHLSASAARRSLVFSSDIKLERDLVVTADVHLDLGGYKLDMNGYTMTFRHGYSGSFVVENGTIRLGEGATSTGIYTDMPYIDSITFEDITAIDFEGAAFLGAVYTDIKNENISLAYNALSLVANAVMDKTTTRADSLSYSELLAKNIAGGAFSADIFLSSRTCSIGNSEEYCSIVFSNLDLPDRLGYADDVMIVYTPSNGAIGTRGIITPSSTEIQSVTLTATVYKAQTVIGSCNFVLHVGDSSVAAQREAAAAVLLDTYLSRFYVESKDKYVFNRSAELPLIFDLGNTDMNISYKLFDANGVEEDDPDITWIPHPNKDDPAKTYVIEFAPSKKGAKLVATIGTTIKEYTIESGITNVTETNASIAKQFLKRAYLGNGDTINVRTTKLEDGSYSYDAFDLKVLDAIALEKGVESVTYTIATDINNMFSISNNVLSVNAGKDPITNLEPVVFQAEFKFNEGKNEIFRLTVNCKLDDGSSDNVSGFLPYYTYYDSQLIQQTAGFSLNSFSLPLSYGKNAIVCYDILSPDGSMNAVMNGDNIYTLSLRYNGTDHAITQPEIGQSVTAVLNAYLSANDLTLAQLTDYGDAQWRFTVNTDNIGTSDIEYKLVYSYKMNPGDVSWTLFNDDDGARIYSSLRVPGVLHQGLDVPDVYLHQWMYEKFTTSDEAYTSTSLVWTSWLTRNVEMDVTAEGLLTNVGDLEGIQYLVGVQNANLAGKVANKDLANIAQMRSLQTLNISGNGAWLYDRTNANAQSNGLFEALSALTNLKTLDISGNNIYSYEFLLNIPTLEKVYLYNNLSPVTANGVFYGSVGLVNFADYQELQSHGVSVYNTATESDSTTVYSLFEDSGEINDYIRLRSVEYQNKIAEGADIRTLYATLSNAPDDYALKTSYTINGVSSTVSAQSLTWGYLDSNGNFSTGAGDDALISNTLALRYNLTVAGTAVSMIVRFDVTRYAQGGVS